MNLQINCVPTIVRQLISAAALLMLSACSTYAPEEVVPSGTLDERAQAAYTAEDWPLTERLYSKLLETQPASARYWYRVAVAQRYLGQFDQALASLDSGSAVGLPSSYADYERAKVAATQGRNADAVELLKIAATAGLSGKDRILENDQLVKLKGSPGYAEVLDQLDSNAFPCRDPKYHEFDFWLGTWEVKTANGVVAGTNSITAKESECMLLEEWTSATGGTGTSMNFYDAVAEHWTQIWISKGLQLKISGGMENGSMVLTGLAHYVQQGTTSAFRGSWTPLEDGRVRQFFEQQDAEGNWNVWFEGFYTRTTSE